MLEEITGALGASQARSDPREQSAGPTPSRPHKVTRQLEILALRSFDLADRVAAGEINFLDAVDLAYSAAVWADLPNAIDNSGLIDTKRPSPATTLYRRRLRRLRHAEAGMSDLRGYQVNVIQDIELAIDAPFRSPLDKRPPPESPEAVLCVLPTGGGKTIVASTIIRRAADAGWRILVLTHRREILKQTS